MVGYKEWGDKIKVVKETLMNSERQMTEKEETRRRKNLRWMVWQRYKNLFKRRGLTLNELLTNSSSLSPLYKRYCQLHLAKYYMIYKLSRGCTFVTPTTVTRQPTYITNIRVWIHTFYFCGALTRFWVMAYPSRASRSHSLDTLKSVGLLWTSDLPDAETSDNTQHSQKTNTQCSGGIQTHNPSKPVAADLRFRVRLHWSHKRHNTTVRTDSRQGSRYQKHYPLCQRLHWNRYDWNVISHECLAPTKGVCSEPTVWSDTCCSAHRIRV